MRAHRPRACPPAPCVPTGPVRAHWSRVYPLVPCVPTGPLVILSSPLVILSGAKNLHFAFLGLPLRVSPCLSQPRFFATLRMTEKVRLTEKGRTTGVADLAQSARA